MISLIVCMAKNRVIGKDNKMPWHLPADLKYLKETTMGHTIVMGRKTFESIGKPLTGRKNVIITRDMDFQAQGCEVLHSIDEVLQLEGDIFCLGGANIYEQLMPHADRLYVTEIDEAFEGDTYFPEFGEEWVETSRTQGVRDEKNPYDFDFVVYRRKQQA